MWVSSNRQPAVFIVTHSIYNCSLQWHWKENIKVLFGGLQRFFFLFFFSIHQKFICFTTAQQLLRRGCHCSGDKTNMELTDNAVIRHASLKIQGHCAVTWSRFRWQEVRGEDLHWALQTNPNKTEPRGKLAHEWRGKQALFDFIFVKYNWL